MKEKVKDWFLKVLEGIKKHWIPVLISAILVGVIGFLIGFNRGENLYIWAFDAEPSTLWTALMGASTVFVAGVAVWQSAKASEAAVQQSEIANRLK